MKWISWYQPTADYRPNQYPPTIGVLAWWKTGEGDKGMTLVALVDAETEEAAKEHIRLNWPEASEWRFCEDKTDKTFSCRYPVQDWMVARGCSNASQLRAREG
ncbi:TPA: hypothetical protein ACP63B_002856 [Escherichia coli]